MTRARSRVVVRRQLPPIPFPHRFDPGRYSPAYLRTGALEAHVQAAIVAYLRARWRATVAIIDVGGAKLRGQAARLMRASGGDPRLLKGRGDATARGIVDLAVTFPGGRAGWFEVKRPACLVPSAATGRLVQKHPAGAPTDEQLAFLLEQHRQGALVGVLWAPKDLDAIVPAPEGQTQPRTLRELPPAGASVNGWEDGWSESFGDVSGGKDLTKAVP